MSSPNDRKPDEVDLHVGARVRNRRRALGMSQEVLATTLGLTFQQCQKYERGVNRISASKLYRIAIALGVAPAYFFEGLGGTPDQPTADPYAAFFTTPGADKLADAYVALPDTKSRRAILNLATGLAGEASD